MIYGVDMAPLILTISTNAAGGRQRTLYYTAVLCYSYSPFDYQDICVMSETLTLFVQEIIHIIVFLNEAVCNSYSTTGKLLHANAETVCVEIGIPNISPHCYTIQ